MAVGVVNDRSGDNVINALGLGVGGVVFVGLDEGETVAIGYGDKEVAPVKSWASTLRMTRTSYWGVFWVVDVNVAVAVTFEGVVNCGVGFEEDAGVGEFAFAGWKVDPLVFGGVVDVPGVGDCVVIGVAVLCRHGEDERTRYFGLEDVAVSGG